MQGLRSKLNLLEDSFFINNNISEVNIMNENRNTHFEYKMPEAMARELLRTRDSADKKLRPNEYLCKYVNEHLGLLRPVSKVILF